MNALQINVYFTSLFIVLFLDMFSGKYGKGLYFSKKLPVWLLPDQVRLLYNLVTIKVIYYNTNQTVVMHYNALKFNNKVAILHFVNFSTVECCARLTGCLEPNLLLAALWIILCDIPRIFYQTQEFESMSETSL